MNEPQRMALGILWQEHNRYAGYPLRWAAIALIEAAQKIAPLEEKPLAVVEGWYREAADDALSMLYVEAPWTVGAVYDSFEGGGLTPVTVTLTERQE